MPLLEVLRGHTVVRKSGDAPTGDARVDHIPALRPTASPSPELREQRLVLGRSALRGPSSRRHLTQRRAPDYFRSYAQLAAALYALQAKYPDLVEVIDINDSSAKKSGKADRDILALRLTSTKITTPKPGVLFIGGQHAREIANPELLMRYAEWLLYPPEDDAANTVPDQDHFERVGKKFASYNGYTAEKSVELYPTSGTSFWAYERFGIPSFTVETGVAFHQSDLTFDDTWKLNFPVMKYATAIADDWRTTSAGPEISRATLGRDGVLTIKAFDRLTRARAAAAEVVFDRSKRPGEGQRAALIAPGLFTTGLTSSATADNKLAYVRAMDADGHWGPLKALWLGAATALSNAA